MYTQCPQCHHTQTLTLEQLRTSRGMIRCEKCSNHFDALQRLSETPSTSGIDTTDEALPWLHTSNETRADHPVWKLLAVTGSVLLLSQILYVSTRSALHNENFRPWLAELCTHLSCELPPYRKIEDFSVVSSSLSPTYDRHYYFKTSIVNQAPFPQARPKIELTLLNLSGEPFARRLLSANDYTHHTDPVAPQDVLEIGLAIAAPQIPIGGYTFELL